MIKIPNIQNGCTDFERLETQCYKGPLLTINERPVGEQRKNTLKNLSVDEMAENNFKNVDCL